MAPLLLALTLHGLQEPGPPLAPADLYQAPVIRPYEMAPEEAEGLSPLPSVPELPEPTPIEAFDPPGPTDELDQLFQRRMAGMLALAEETAGPLDGAWTVSLDLPGVSREQLAIAVDGAVVRVQTAKEAPRQYQVAYELPADIDVDATSAKLENGVLTLTLGKKKPVVTARTIEVK